MDYIVDRSQLLIFNTLLRGAVTFEDEFCC